MMGLGNRVQALVPMPHRDMGWFATSQTDLACRRGRGPGAAYHCRWAYIRKRLKEV